ncbi:MAG: hypothetical protein EP299_01815 [Acidobacteria bacterium]|nr:MAG: hypothetical protein EP299_01815 [Acidobacteriota bacterium]
MTWLAEYNVQIVVESITIGDMPEGIIDGLLDALPKEWFSLAEDGHRIYFMYETKPHTLPRRITQDDQLTRRY